MVGVLSDAVLYAFTGGEPPGPAELEARYLAQVAGASTPDEVWHNWIIRLGEPPVAAGFVQATVTGAEADIAWVVGSPWQRRGIATEAAIAMCWWLASTGVQRLTAHIHPEHAASAKVATACGLLRTDEIDEDGEVVWRGPAPSGQPTGPRSLPRL